MPKKPIGDTAMTGAERAAKHYHDNRDETALRRIAKRVREGSIPQHRAIKQYSITRQWINERRHEAGLPEIHTDAQLDQARSWIRVGKDPTKLTFIGRLPVREPVPPPPQFSDHTVAYVSDGTAPPGGGKGKGKGKGRAERPPEDDGGEGTSGDPEPPQEKQPLFYAEDGRPVYDVPKDMVMLKICATQTHPTEYKKSGKWIKYSAISIKDNINGMHRSLLWWSKRLDIPYDETMDVAQWLADNAHKMLTAAAKIKTVKDWNPNSTSKPTNVPERVKKLFTPITGMINKYCQDFGKAFKLNHPGAWDNLTAASGEAKGRVDDATIKIQESTTPEDWDGARKRAFAAIKTPPKPGAPLNEWQEYLMLLLWAGPGMQPTRDNAGSIKIVNSERDAGKMLDSEQERLKDGTIQKVHDYYVIKQSKIIYRTFKTRGVKGQVEHPVTPSVNKRVMESLQAYPREWLIIQPTSWKKGDPSQSKPYGKGISALAKQPGALGMGTNEARHAYISWWYLQKTRTPSEEKALAKRMMNDLDVLRQYRKFKDPKKSKK